jgi:hypothetical protein
MQTRMLRRLALAAAATLALASPALALSLDAQKIVDLVKKENPVLKPVCSDQDKLRTSVTEATTSLYKQGQISGNPKSAGQEAGKYLYENCA